MFIEFKLDCLFEVQCFVWARERNKNGTFQIALLFSYDIVSFISSVRLNTLDEIENQTRKCRLSEEI